MTVRMGSERHISGESAVMPLPDVVPAEVAGAAAILGHGTRYRGSAKLEAVAREGHLGGLALPKQEVTTETAKSGVKQGDLPSWSYPFSCCTKEHSCPATGDTI